MQRLRDVGRVTGTTTTVEDAWAAVTNARALGGIWTEELLGPVAALRDHDEAHQTAYLETVAAWLDHPGDPREAAARHPRAPQHAALPDAAPLRRRRPRPARPRDPPGPATRSSAPSATERAAVRPRDSIAWPRMGEVDRCAGRTGPAIGSRVTHSEFERIYGPLQPWTPAEAAEVLDGLDVPWWVAGGLGHRGVHRV